MIENLMQAMAVVEPKKHGRVTAVAKATGYSKAMISAVFTGREPLQEKLLNAICSAYGINREWVKTGQGEMLSRLNIKNADGVMAEKMAFDVLQKAKELRDEIDAMIEVFDSNNYPPHELMLSAEDMDLMYADDKEYSVRESVIDTSAAVIKGSKETLPVLHHTNEENKTPSWDGVEKISCPFGMDPDACFAVRISGDSMSPKYDEGDVVIADPVVHPESGKTVVAKLTDGRLLVRRFRSAGDVVILESINQNPRYEPVVIAKDQIESLFRIAWVYSPVSD